MFKQPGKKARLQAAQRFKRELDPEELRLFEESYEKDTNKWHQEFKDEWKKAKKKHGVEVEDEYQEAENRERWKRNENH